MAASGRSRVSFAAMRYQSLKSIRPRLEEIRDGGVNVAGPCDFPRIFCVVLIANHWHIMPLRLAIHYMCAAMYLQYKAALRDLRPWSAQAMLWPFWTGDR